MMFKKFTATEKLANAIAALTTARDATVEAMRESSEEADRLARELGQAEATAKRAAVIADNLTALLGE